MPVTKKQKTKIIKKKKSSGVRITRLKVQLFVLEGVFQMLLF